ncbi:MAG TPA: phage portal protein [Armatimonadota bacterium]|jgi:HK97 family phage portal protein
MQPNQLSAIELKFPELAQHKSSKCLETKSADTFRPIGGTMGSLAFHDMRLPGGTRNVSVDVGDAYLNDVVSACLGWITRSYGECQPQVEKLNDQGSYEVVPDHPLSNILRRPNPNMSGRLMRRAIAFDLALHGNAYLKIDRDAYNRAQGLSWLSASYITPYGSNDPARPIDRYCYRLRGYAGMSVGLAAEYPAEDVVHLRTSVDPDIQAMGLATIASCYRSVDVDNRVSVLYSALMRNMGLIPVMYSPAEGQLSEEQQAQLSSDIALGYTADNAGNPMVTSVALNVAKLAQSPDEMAVVEIREQVIRRICAAMGLDALVVGLDASSATFANKETAERSAWDNRILPDLYLLGDDFETQLLPAFEPKPQLYRIHWDTTGVRALQEGQDAIYKRADTGFRGGWIALNESRNLVGLPPTGRPEDDLPTGKPTTAPQYQQGGTNA